MKQGIYEKISLENKNVILTGASGHLGRELVKTLADLKANIILVDKPGTDFSKFYEQVKNNVSPNARQFECDFENQNSRLTLIQQIKS